MIKKNRHEFISKSTTAVAGLSVGLHAFGSEKTSRIFGANDKLRVGFIGVGNRGSQLLERFMKNKDVEEQYTNSNDANQLLSYTYRKSWRL